MSVPFYSHQDRLSPVITDLISIEEATSFYSNRDRRT